MLHLNVNGYMKTLLLFLFSQALLASAQAQTTPPSQFRLSEKFKLRPRSSERVVRVETVPMREQARQPQQLTPGGAYRSYPHAMRVIVPDSGSSKMPQAAAQAGEGSKIVRQLPLQQYLPEQPAPKPERNSFWQDKHSGSKP